MVACLILGGLALVAAIGFLSLAIYSANPTHLISVPGVLTEKKGYKHLRVKRRHIPVYTEYAYTYEVKGKLYYYRGAEEKHRRFVPQRVSIVYLKGFPRIAGVERFSAAALWILGILFSLLGLLCFVAVAVA